jgi:UDP-N-acetylglucosamine acyltransferase
MEIHPTAVVSSKAELGLDVKIGPHAVIEDDVTIGDGSEIGAGSYIDKYTKIGRGCRIFPMASLGTAPQDVKYKGEKTELVLGDRVLVREFATLNRGTVGGGGITSVGDDCMLMAYTHVAHDCQVGHRVILANNLAMAGHVVIQDDAYIGGMVAIHQFSRIGAHSYIGGFSRIPKDVPPYMLGEGAPEFTLHGPNVIGLRRKGFSNESIRALKEAFRIIFRNRRPLEEVLQEAEEEYGQTPEVRYLIDFIRTSQRGVFR